MTKWNQNSSGPSMDQPHVNWCLQITDHVMWSGDRTGPGPQSHIDPCAHYKLMSQSVWGFIQNIYLSFYLHTFPQINPSIHPILLLVCQYTYIDTVHTLNEYYHYCCCHKTFCHELQWRLQIRLCGFFSLCIMYMTFHHSIFFNCAKQIN